MKLKKLFLITLLPIFFFVGKALGGQDNWRNLISIPNTERQERIDLPARAQLLLNSERYDELGRLADQYRSSKDMFSDGEWKLNVIYDGLSFYGEQNIPEEFWKQRLGKLESWVNKDPDSVTGRIALAEFLVGYAFQGRTWKYANQVKEDQWNLFYERLNLAGTKLTQVKNIEQKCPGGFASLQRIVSSFGVDKSKYDQLFGAAIAFEPKYNVYYFRKAWRLLPWWYGEKGEWEQFAKSAADTLGGKEGDILYARIIWFMDRRSPKKIVDQNPHISWDRVINGINFIKSDNHTANVKPN